jgi:hypothetical protein
MVVHAIKTHAALTSHHRCYFYIGDPAVDGLAVEDKYVFKCYAGHLGNAERSSWNKRSGDHVGVSDSRATIVYSSQTSVQRLISAETSSTV